MLRYSKLRYETDESLKRLQEKEDSFLELKTYRQHFLQDEIGKEPISYLSQLFFQVLPLVGAGHLRVSIGKNLPLRRQTHLKINGFLEMLNDSCLPFWQAQHRA